MSSAAGAGLLTATMREELATVFWMPVGVLLDPSPRWSD